MKRIGLCSLMLVFVAMLLSNSALFAQLPPGVVFNNYEFYCEGISNTGNYIPPDWSLRNASPDKENFDGSYFGAFQWGTSVDLMGWSSTTTDGVFIGGWRGSSSDPGFNEYESVETTITGLTPGETYEYSLEAAANVIATQFGNPASGSNATSATFEILFDGVSGGTYLLDPQNPVAQVYAFCFVADGDGESVISINTGSTQVGGADGDNPWIFILGSTGSFVSLGNVGCNVILPVELTAFTAITRQDKESVRLQWTTANEINNDYFIIESSEDMKKWNDIAQVQGNGNHTGDLNYNTIDYDPFTGMTYYRLKQVDFDGESSYSNSISVELDDQCHIQVSPNPCAGVLQLKNLQEKEIAFELYNVDGEMIQISQVTNVTKIELNAGVYVLRYYCGGETKTDRIVVY